MIRVVVIVFMLVACTHCQQEPLLPCVSNGSPVINLDLLAKYQTIQMSTPTTLPAVLKVTSNGACKSSADIVFVVDVSGSMYGTPIYLIKKSLEKSLKLLTSCDRIAIVSFSSSATLVSEFKRASPANTAYFTNKINSLIASGGTNIPSGMKLAFQVLRNRIQVNQVTLIALQSDGVNNNPNPLQQIQSQLALPINANLGSFTIDTFLYGDFVDQILMKNIADLKDGALYRISNIQQAQEFIPGISFASAISGYKNIVASQTLIKVQIIPSGSFSGITVSATYGSQWKYISPNNYQIKIIQIHQQTLELNFDLDIPSLSGVVGQMGVIVSAKMTAIGICAPLVPKEAYLYLKLIGPNDPLQGLNFLVVANHLRAIVVKSLNDVYAKANTGDSAGALQAIDYSTNLITSNTEVQQERMQPLKNDLLAIRQAIDQNNLLRVKIMCMVAINNHGDQKGLAYLSPTQVAAIQFMKYLLIISQLREDLMLNSTVVLLSSSSSNTIVISPTNQVTVSEFFRNLLYPDPFSDGSQWVWRSPASNAIASQTITFKTQFYSYCNRPAYLFIIAQSNSTVTLNGGPALNASGKIDNTTSYILYSLKCGLNTITITVNNLISSNYSGIIFRVQQDQNGCFDCNGSKTFFNKKTCKCECIKGCNCTSTNKLYTWRDYPDCFCNCTKWLDCPSNQYFNENTCACECNPTYCQQKFTLNPTSCNCTCKKVTKCSSPQLWNPKTCLCECPTIAMCTTNLTVWAPLKCQCQCIKKPKCSTAQTWNTTTCECDCKVKNTTCPGNMFWNRTTCACQCLQRYICTTIQVWNAKTCVCDCKNKLVCLPTQFINRTTCTCQCNQILECTPGLTVFNPKTCVCDCIKKLSCPPLIQKFNTTTCDCQCIKANTCDPTIQFWNVATCACQCNDTLKKFNTGTKKCDCIKKLTCTNATFYAFSSDTCRCECKDISACSPPQFTRNSANCLCQCLKKQSDCNQGEVLDQPTCTCMPGP